MRILIAAGGSGGHIFPAVALAEELKFNDPSVEILFVGSDKALDKRIFVKEGYEYRLLSSNKLPYKTSFKTLLFSIRLSIDILKSFIILAKYSPDAVVGFGGYVSAPIIVAAYILGIPRILHEQNAVPGRANAMLFKFVSSIAVSFEETKKYLGSYADKAVFTGNPIRASVLKDDKSGSMKKMGLDPQKFTILVIGGSQGAHNLNKAFIKSLSMMDEKIRRSLQIIHITGVTDYGWASDAYKELSVEHRVHSFVDRIEEVYSASDLIVTRSGASAIFEIAYFGRPMILIPYPFALSHQSENARIFSARGAAVKIDEKDLSPILMKERVEGLLKDRNKLSEIGESARRMSVPDSSRSLARAVLGIAKEGSK
ncbi:MAG: undecaprenyldiphospho-muramoylpentapeptide beta-N-acetylglucosaminyltransferase [Candidatus Omnitrophota bacterium]|nr:undecaprenyldiphospho-muramoylpentapeptide beta-N-acetylglucosaminyltransferase [Candidatus Omnitrophota bacterium]